MIELRGKRILVTGPAGQIASPPPLEAPRTNAGWGVGGAGLLPGRVAAARRGGGGAALRGGPRRPRLAAPPGELRLPAPPRRLPAARARLRPGAARERRGHGAPHEPLPPGPRLPRRLDLRRLRLAGGPTSR